jgi:hypothetical protein
MRTHTQWNKKTDKSQSPAEKENASMILLTDTLGYLECKEALGGENLEKWRISVKKEYETITKNEVFRIVDRPKESILRTRWILGKEILREWRKQKALFIIQGWRQPAERDFMETFAPTPCKESLCDVSNIISTRKNVLL